MALLLVDAGNTRIKWRLHGPGDDWNAAAPQGAVALADADGLARLWATLPIERALLACVADDTIHARVAAALAAHWPTVPLNRIRPTRAACGVINRYRDPNQLGADRWAAVLGAAGLYPQRVLVVASFGTATTLDLVEPAVPTMNDARTGDRGPSTAAAASIAAGNLAADCAGRTGEVASAHFAGGVILPGIELMRAALFRGTARLPLAGGTYQEIATNTDDAITSGILHAQAGAIERFWRLAGARARAGTPGVAPLCLVGGGAAAQVLPLLDAQGAGIELLAAQDLVLRGLARLAAEYPDSP